MPYSSVYGHERTLAILCGAILAALVMGSPGDLRSAPGLSPSKLLGRSGFSWRTEETPHFLIHYEADSYAEKDLGRLTSAHENAIPRILELIGERDFSEKIHIFAVENLARMKRLTSREILGMAFCDQNMICCVFSKNTQAVGAHEVMHVISFKRWGGLKSERNWLSEGLAVYSDDQWRGYGLHSLSRYLRDSGQLVPLEQLVAKLSPYSSMISYPECGSFIKFLYEHYGREKLKELWQAHRVDMRRVFGKSLPEIEADWLVVVERADASGINYSVKSP